MLNGTPTQWTSWFWSAYIIKATRPVSMIVKTLPMVCLQISHDVITAQPLSLTLSVLGALGVGAAGAGVTRVRLGGAPVTVSSEYYLVLLRVLLLTCSCRRCCPPRSPCPPRTRACSPGWCRAWGRSRADTGTQGYPEHRGVIQYVSELTMDLTINMCRR